jgi:hypothetical protein
MYDWLGDLVITDKAGSSFFTQARKIYYVPDGNGGFVTGGYYRFDSNMDYTFLTIPKAGHFVPSTNLQVTKQML